MKKVFWVGVCTAVFWTGCDTGGADTAATDEKGDTDTPDGGMDLADDDAGDDAETGSTGNVKSDWPVEKYISVDAVHRKTVQGDDEMFLVNVVDEEFYTLGHIEGSLKIPWDTLDAHLGEVDAAKHVVIYCRKGVRSESAYETLKGANYPMVWVMEGGIEVWIEKGYPTVP